MIVHFLGSYIRKKGIKIPKYPRFSPINYKTIKILAQNWWEKRGYFGYEIQHKIKKKKNKWRRWWWWKKKKMLVASCGEDLGNWVLFFCSPRIHCHEFCWEQKFFHWNTYGTAPPCSSYQYCHGCQEIPELPQLGMSNHSRPKSVTQT